MTPYGRLALLAGGTVWAVVLVLVARYLGGWITAVLVAGIAIVAALVATLEIASGSRPPAVQDLASSEGAKQEVEDFAIRRRERAEIERSARRAADEA